MTAMKIGKLHGIQMHTLNQTLASLVMGLRSHIRFLQFLSCQPLAKRSTNFPASALGALFCVASFPVCLYFVTVSGQAKYTVS